MHKTKRKNKNIGQRLWLVVFIDGRKRHVRRRNKWIHDGSDLFNKIGNTATGLL